jgi:hypothetical protein
MLFSSASRWSGTRNPLPHKDSQGALEKTESPDAPGWWV